MAIPKFKFGDRAVLNGHLGTIESIYMDANGGYICRIKFDNQFLIPPEMEVEEYLLTKAASTGNYSNDPKGKCPKCGEKWHITKMNMHVWYDCVKCKKTKEELIDS